MPKQMSIGRLRSRIKLCSMRDVVEQNGTMKLTREEALECWAAIEAYRNYANFVGMGGYVVLDPHVHKSHIVTIRRQTNVDITSAAWVYEARRTSPPRWYKVLGFSNSDCNRWIVISVHLHEVSDNASPPTKAACSRSRRRFCSDLELQDVFVTEPDL